MMGLSFFYPAALGLLAISPLLVLAYLNRSPKRERIVSSLLLLRHLPKVPAIREKIKLPPRFFLELLILFLLAAASAYPRLNARGERIAILVDNSMSMGAASGAGRRADLAVKEIKGWLGLRSSKDRFTLYLSSPRLRRISEELVERSEIEGLLDKIVLSDAPDYLDGTLSQLVSSGQYGRAFVVSDKLASFTGTSSGQTFPVDVRTVGEPVANVGIVNLRLERKKDSGNTVVASLALFGSRPMQATIRALSISSSQVVAETPVSLEPKRIVEARLTLSKNYAETLRVEVHVSHADRNYLALGVDNAGYLNLGAAQGKNILIVSEEDPGENVFGLRGLGAEAIRASGYSSFPEARLKEFRAIIFDGAVPRELPSVPSLFLSPPLDNAIYPGAGEVSSPAISSWRAESPLTNDVNFQLIKLNRCVVLKPPDWSEPILNVEQGPVIVSGESQGVRSAAVGFALLPFEGRRTPTLSVLTLNLLSWLSGGAQFEETMRTGGALPVPAEGSWRLIQPGGDVLDSKTWKHVDGAPRADKSGIYILQTADKERQIIVNAFHPDESATDEQLSFEASYAVEQQKEDGGDSTFWRELIGIILLLTAVELIWRLAAFFNLRELAGTAGRRAKNAS